MLGLNIYTNFTLNELVTIFLNKGGRVDKYYLHDWNKNKHTTLYLNGWVGGKNVREALIKAIG